MGGMERVNRIWNHPAYQEALGKLTAYEASGNSAAIRRSIFSV